MVKILFYIFRKISPIENDGLAPSRSNTLQTEKMQKVIVNSQVTAFTTVCESIGHFVIFLLAFVTKSSEFSSEITQLVFIGLHFNLLPYVFLINTRENKSRLVEHGWINLIRNIICCANFSLPNNNVVPFQHVEYNVKNDICIISQTQKSASSARSKCTRLNIPTSECTPTSSKGTREIINYHRQISVSSTSSLQSSDLQAQFLKRNREKILSDLLSNINDEKPYIDHFLRLSDLESGHHNEDEANGFDRSSHEIVLNIWKKLLCKSSLETRVRIRKDIIQKLQMHLGNNDTYKELLENYLRMEENFLDDEYYNESS